jgi:uncharacterized caspase-like protein
MRCILLCKSFFEPFIFVILVFFIFVFPNSTNAQQSRLALVIGNESYNSAPLKNPVNDARDVSAALGSMGFEVIIELNATQRKMEEAIRKFGKKLKGREVGLFYFAGHGMQVDGINYLIPVDTKIESESDVKFEAVAAGVNTEEKLYRFY